MAKSPIDVWLRPEDDAAAYAELTSLAEQLRNLILAQPLPELLGYLYAQLLLARLHQDDDSPAHVQSRGSEDSNQLSQTQFVLEYAHAAWAGTAAEPAARLDETSIAPLLATAKELCQKAMKAAMRWALRHQEGPFGEANADLLIRALQNWIMLRGNRYQVMEDEFYRFALAPHDDALRLRFGAGAGAIANGIQALADALRMGQAQAIATLEAAFDEVQERVERQGISLDAATEQWRAEGPHRVVSMQDATADLLMGGICHVNRHCDLPLALLEVLAYQPGEEGDFWAAGDFAGSPFRTLPARKRPLIRLGEEFYLTDPSFVRDASYPILLHQLQQGDDAHRTAFRQRQQSMAEDAFSTIFGLQLQHARVYRSVYYRIAGSNWRENDTVILLEDTLIIVEAKAGVAATVASPATDFPRHARAIQDLIVKAYTQCKGLLDRLEELDELPLCEYRDGHYREVVRLRLGDFRRIIPIGLTVESMSPFSAAAARLPGITPILGRYPFISVAIDELFVLRRVLPSTGALLHYLAVRQAAAGLPQLLLFDETDHLGAYLRYGRYPDALMRQHGAGRADLILADGMSSSVDAYFMDPEGDPVATAGAPAELDHVLTALEAGASPGWLEVNEMLRDLPMATQEPLATYLRVSRLALRHQTHVFGWVHTTVPLVFWYRRRDGEDDPSARPVTGAVAAFARTASACLIVVSVDADQTVRTATAERVSALDPAELGAVPQTDLRRQEWRLRGLAEPPTGVAPGRNAPCWCGSGQKYKRCHGP
jgi:hypothetical protein